MVVRRIGQEQLALGGVERGRNAGLDELAQAVDWEPLERRLSVIYRAKRGEAAWPPLAMFKALLLGIWHDLSDVKLAAALDDRASFRRFCGFASSEPTPERTAFVRFRRELLRHGLDEALFKAVVHQLERRNLVVRTGTLVDATIIPAAHRDDTEARWSKYKKRRPIKGYKAHVATDADGSLVRAVTITPAHVHDSQGLAPVLPWHPGRVYADAAYDGAPAHEAIRRRGGRPHVVKRLHPRSRPALNDAKRAWNASLKPIRCRIEKVFGTAKRSYGLARSRYRGLARTALQVRLTFLAYNLKRVVALMRPRPA